jgi:hypothetical protein
MPSEEAIDADSDCAAKSGNTMIAIAVHGTAVSVFCIAVESSQQPAINYGIQARPNPQHCRALRRAGKAQPPQISCSSRWA